MDHPNIAKVLDAGCTETGRPFFVMELVKGIKITDYCDQNNLPMRERLRLYELLTGRTPFDAKDLLRAGLDEIRRVIREEEPPRPSTRVSTMIAADLSEIAKQRQADPARLMKLLHGDLDWIVMKALEKKRSRRYETADGLAMDVQRYLADEPVVARPPSSLYRYRKWFVATRLLSPSRARCLSLYFSSPFLR